MNTDFDREFCCEWVLLYSVLLAEMLFVFMQAFCPILGADLNQQDKFGRSPLHVAAAVDYADMVRFLVKNGADINIQTYGEEQMPIHYAAKNDACKSLKMLLGYGANIDSRDMKNRTPLQVRRLIGGRHSNML